MMTFLNDGDLSGGERRRFFRVAPAVEEPIILRTAVGSFPLIEISGGGCRLPIAAHLGISEVDELDLCLPGRSCKISVRLRPVVVGEKVFGAEFIDLEPESREVICAYVRSREIELARRFYSPARSTC
ncbi:MAG: PilZ domain-containing protein [Deltaproteobacteria bacterium]|nr:PilZ domain-containing protein [Deltaproteobacteria bacterium]